MPPAFADQFSDAMQGIIALHGESLTRNIAGDTSDTEIFVGIVNLATESGAFGQGRMPGDGQDMSDRYGESKRLTMILEIATAQTLTEEDTVTHGVDVWSVVRDIGSDGGRKQVLCTRTIGFSSRDGRLQHR